MKSAVLLVLVFVNVAVVAGQNHTFDRPGNWHTLTDMSSVRSLASTQGSIWVASEGGLFRWQSPTETITKYTNAEGLSSNDLTAVMADPMGRIWVGTSGGSVNVLMPESNQWIAIEDIKNSVRIQKSIRAFSISGDSLFIGSDFGVSVFRLSRWEFGDTYANFGFSAPAPVNSIVVMSDRLWVITDQGVASAERFLTNLSAPTGWTRFQTGQGLPANRTTAAEVFHDTLIVGTSAGAAFYNGVSFQTISSLSGSQVISLVTTSSALNILVMTGGYNLGTLTALDASPSWIASHPVHVPTALIFDPTESSFFIGTSDQGVDELGATSRSIVPNGPMGNLFSSLVVDESGVLWYGTGISGQGRGFGRYNPLLASASQWKNFTFADNPLMGSNDYYKVAVGLQGRIWASSWGDGAVEVLGDSVVRKIDTGSIPSFATSDVNDPAYPVINGVAVDLQGRTWFVNWAAKNRNFLACLTSDTTFSYHTTGLVPEGYFTGMVIDRNNTKWLANSEPFHPAKGLYLYYYNEDKSVSGTTLTDGWGFMTESDGLPRNNVLSLAVDFDGNVCVGTDLGLMIISDPLFPKQRHFSSFPLREQSIQALAVDALNNKWVGTKEGIFVMNVDATQILQQYTVASTGGKLVENDIRALAIDQRRGTVYIGTEKGLSSLSIEAVMPVRSSKDLAIGPNPFTVPSATQLVIGNLVAESSIKILTVDGSLVSEFKAQGGGRAFWNGRDKKGDLVGSGIYFVVAFAQDGDQIGTGKVAVIRKK